MKRYSMSCPKCGGRALVIDTHPNDQTITRTRLCESCGDQFNTIEYIVVLDVAVAVKDAQQRHAPKPSDVGN